MFFYLHRTTQMKKETVNHFSFLISLAFILSETRLLSLKHDHSVRTTTTVISVISTTTVAGKGRSRHHRHHHHHHSSNFIIVATLK
jgi:hypothetical protein